MRRILLIMAMLLVCTMCFARTYGLTLHLHAYVPSKIEVAWHGEVPAVVWNFNESATAVIEEWSGYQVVTFTAA